MNDDLNAPAAAAALFGLERAATPVLRILLRESSTAGGAEGSDDVSGSAIGGEGASAGAAAVLRALNAFDRALGIFYDPPDEAPDEAPGEAPDEAARKGGGTEGSGTKGRGLEGCDGAAGGRRPSGCKGQGNGQGENEPSDEVLGLVAARRAARAARDWASADELRGKLEALGWDLADDRDGDVVITPRSPQ